MEFSGKNTRGSILTLATHKTAHMATQMCKAGWWSGAKQSKGRLEMQVKAHSKRNLETKTGSDNHSGNRSESRGRKCAK